MKKVKALQIYNQFVQRHPNAKKVINGFGYLFSEKIIKFAVGFIVHTLIARFLGAEQFGKLSYITKTVGVFYAFSAFGVDELVIQYLMDKRHAREDVLKTVLSLRLIMSFIAFCLLGIFLLINRPGNDSFSLLIFAYGIQIFIQAFNLFELNFQADLLFKPLFWANNLSNFFAAGLRIIGIGLSQGIPYFISTYLAGDILLKILVQWRQGFQFLKGKFDLDLAMTLAKRSWPYFLAAFIVLFDQRLSFIYIEKFLDGKALGNYSVAVTLVDLWIFLPTAASAAILPTIVSVFEDNKPAYEIRVQYLSDILVWTSIFFCSGVFIFSDYFIGLLYGSTYETAPEIIKWYSLVTIPVFFNLARLKWMSLENHLLDWLQLCILALLLNFFLHLWLVPVHGVKGAIWSFLFSQILVNVLGMVWLKSSIKSCRIFLKTLSFPFRMLQKLR